MSRDWEKEFEERPTCTSVSIGLRVIAFFAVMLVVGGVVFGVISWVGSWGNEAARIVGPGNVREQHTAIIGDFESLQTAADNACSAGKSAKGEDDPTLVENPAQAYAGTYRRIVVDYNRRQKNLFEAKLVGPAGYPRSIPNLAPGPDPDWCDVSAQINALNP